MEIIKDAMRFRRIGASAEQTNRIQTVPIGRQRLPTMKELAPRERERKKMSDIVNEIE